MATLGTLIVGDTPLDPWTLTDPSGNIVNLTGLVAGTSGVSPCNFTVLLQDTLKGKEYIGAGVIAITNASQGKITYAWNAQDSSVPMIGYFALTSFNVFVRIIDGQGNTNTYGGVQQPMSRA